MSCMKPLTGSLVIALLLAAGSAQAANQDDAWRIIRTQLFGSRQVQAAAAGSITLEAPQRAADAALVPISIHFRKPQAADAYVKTLYLVVDKNPGPVAAVVHLGPGNGLADFATRIRINDFTTVRAIAEMSNGALFMASRYVKAAGGCSVPASKDPAAAQAHMGQMLLRLPTRIAPGRPALVQLMIRHPNTSGLARDQVTHLFQTPNYIKQIRVIFSDQPVFSAETNYGISENPNFRFYFLPQGKGELKAEAVDLSGRHYQTAVLVTPTGT